MFFGVSLFTSFLIFLLLTVTVFRITYLIVIKHWNYFDDRHVKCIRGLPIVGTLFTTIMKRLPMAEATQTIYNTFPDQRIIGMYEVGGQPSFMVRDINLIRDITVKDFDHFHNHFFKISRDMDPLMGRVLFSMYDQEWRDMRATLSPLFTGTKMRSMLALMNDALDQFCECLSAKIRKESSNDEAEFDMMKLMTCLTNDLISTSAFGLEMNTLEDPDNEFYKAGTEMAYALFRMQTFVIMAFPEMAKLLKMRVLPERINDFFRKVIRRTVQERKENKIVRPDMIHLLLMAKEGKLNEQRDKDEDQDTGFATISEIITANVSKKLKNWNEDDLVAQTVVFFLAGFTGVANTIAFLFYELAVNQSIQDRLYEEIRETYRQLDGEPITFEALQRMKYLDMVVSELLRKWPIAVLMDRSVTKQYVIEDNDGGNKILLQPNDVIWIPTFAIHRDKKHYPEPERFDPERFSDENKHKIQHGSYLPFGLGPRACIANRFALLQLKVTCYKVLMAFETKCSPQTQIPLRLKQRVNNLMADKGFWNILKIRTGSESTSCG